MVLSSNLVVVVANLSANLCQYIACNPERLSGDQVLHLLFCFPLHQLSRLSLSLWTYLCYNPTNRRSSIFSSDSDSDSDSEDNSHSD